MVARTHAAVKVFDPDNVGPIRFGGGVLIPLPADGSWPRTELPVLPSAQRTLHDTTGDGIGDIVLTTRIVLHDMDQNGVADAIHLRVTGGEAIQADVPLECGPEEREQAIRRVIEQL